MTFLPEIVNPTRLPYASDLSDAQWELWKPIFPYCPNLKGLGLQKRKPAFCQHHRRQSATLCSFPAPATKKQDESSFPALASVHLPGGSEQNLIHVHTLGLG